MGKLRWVSCGGCLLQGGWSASLLSMLRRAAFYGCSLQGGGGVLRSWPCFGGRLLVGVYYTGGGSASLLGMLRRAVVGGCLLQGGRECFALEHASAGGCWRAFTARGEGELRSSACFGGRLLVGVNCRGEGSASLLGVLRRAAFGGRLLQGEGVLHSWACFGGQLLVGVYCKGEGVLRSWACFGGRLMVGVNCRGGGSVSLFSMFRRTPYGGS